MRTIDDRADDVKSAIGRVRDRIKSHSSQYSASAVATCYQLVFPVLRVLGWDPDNPATTQFLSDAPDGRVRLALRRDDGAAVILDVKNLGPNMDLPPPAKIDDVLMASDVADASVVAYTDGDEWVVYRQEEAWERRAKRLLESENFELGYWLDRQLSESETGEVSNGNGPKPPDLEWQRLDERPAMGVVPKRVRFRGDHEVLVSTFSGTFAAIGKYLVESNQLSARHLPLGVTRTDNVIFNSEPRHPNGKAFVRKEELAPGIWMETLISSSLLVEYSIRAFHKLKADPAAVEFYFGFASTPQPRRQLKAEPQLPDGTDYSVAELTDVDVTGTTPNAVTTHIGNSTRVSGWSDLFERVVRELVTDGRLTKRHLPISLPRGRGKSIARTSAFHRDGSAFRSPVEVVDGMVFESAGSAKQIVRWLEYLLELAELSMDAVTVRFPVKIGGQRRLRRRRNRSDESEIKVTRWHQITREIDVTRPLGQAQIGSNERIPLESWRDLYQVVANHLINSGQLTRAPMPLGVTTGGRCMMNRTPTHPNGAPFRAPRELDGGLWLEVDHSNQQIVRLTVRLLEMFEFPPENIGVSFADEDETITM